MLQRSDTDEGMEKMRVMIAETKTFFGENKNVGINRFLLHRAKTSRKVKGSLTGSNHMALHRWNQILQSSIETNSYLEEALRKEKWSRLTS